MPDAVALVGSSYQAFFKLDEVKSGRYSGKFLKGPGVVLDMVDFQGTGKKNFCILYAYKPSDSKIASLMRQKGSHHGGVYVDFFEKDGDVDIVKRPEEVPRDAAVDMYLENLLGSIGQGSSDPIPEVVSPLVEIRHMEAVLTRSKKRV